MITTITLTFDSLRTASTTPHRIPAVQTLVARAATHRDAAADVARRGVGLHVGALLAERVGVGGETRGDRHLCFRPSSLAAILSRQGRGSNRLGIGSEVSAVAVAVLLRGVVFALVAWREFR